MELDERGIFVRDDNATDETFYFVKYIHRGKVLFESQMDFLSVEEAIRFRDSMLDQRNIKKTFSYVTGNKVKYRYKAEFYCQGRRFRKTFDTFSEAVSWRKKMRIEKQKGTVILEKTMLFSDFSKYWIENEVEVIRARSTQESYKAIMRNHIAPFMNDFRLSAIKVHNVNEFMATLKRKNLKISSISLIMSVFQRCMEFALINDIIGKNVVKTVNKLTGQQPEPKFWETEDLQKFFSYIAAKPSFPLFYTAAKTGMRKGELSGLKWDCVDFTTGMIKVEHTRTNNDPKAETKSKKIRRVPMTDELSDILGKLKEKNSALKQDYVFLSHRNKPISYHSINGLFYQYQDEAKVSVKISFHNLRHSFASHFAMEGGNLELLQVLLGHSNFKTTERYRHFSDAFIKGAKDIISKTKVEPSE